MLPLNSYAVRRRTANPRIPPVVKKQSPTWLQVVVASLGVVSTALLVPALPTWLYEFRFGRLVDRLTLPSMVDCGRVPPKRLDTPPELRCALQSLATGVPFVVVLDGPFGIDSGGADAFMHSGKGSALVSLRYTIPGREFQLTQNVCQNPTFVHRSFDVRIVCAVPSGH